MSRHHCATPAASAAASATSERRTTPLVTPGRTLTWSAVALTRTAPPRRERSMPIDGSAVQPSASISTHAPVPSGARSQRASTTSSTTSRSPLAPSSSWTTAPVSATAAVSPPASPASTSSRPASLPRPLADQARPEHRSGDQRIRRRLDRDHLVEQVAATAAVLLADRDAGQTHLDDGLPGLRERSGGIGLGLPHRGRPAEVSGPGAQRGAEFEMIATHPDRHWLASESRTCFNNHSDGRRGHLISNLDRRRCRK